ncbi:MAG: SprT-like domain-containing protein [Planctomycetota bacterium]|nr:SprT-like domain-containing protein [Planctomycetota bacterium]
MTLLEARQLARTLMKEHALADWRFMFDRAKRRFGCCHYRQKLITLSQPLTLLNGENEVRDTLLHEIAHALTPRDGHGRRWQAQCVQIGAKPATRYSEQAVVSPARAEAKYLHGCRACDWWVKRRRLTARVYVCARCRARLFHRDAATGRFFVVAASADGRLIKRFDDLR